MMRGWVCRFLGHRWHQMPPPYRSSWNQCERCNLIDPSFPAAGIYYYDFLVVGDGTHEYRFAATGAVTAAVEGSFHVTPTHFP